MGCVRCAAPPAQRKGGREERMGREAGGRGSCVGHVTEDRPASSVSEPSSLRGKRGGERGGECEDIGERERRDKGTDRQRGGNSAVKFQREDDNNIVRERGKSGPNKTAAKSHRGMPPSFPLKSHYATWRARPCPRKVRSPTTPLSLAS